MSKVLLLLLHEVIEYCVSRVLIKYEYGGVVLAAILVVIVLAIVISLVKKRKAKKYF
jgi:hypothetical protein